MASWYNIITNPSEKYMSVSVGIMIPNWMEQLRIFETTNQLVSENDLQNS